MDYHNKYIVWGLGIVQRYNGEKYWKMREYLQNFQGRITLKALWYLYRVKKMDAFANTSTGVTIGNDFTAEKRAPKIGDNVEIYPGAKIIGGISIGDNVKIGANAVVTSDIPANAVVVVEKPRVIIKNS